MILKVVCLSEELDRPLKGSPLTLWGRGLQREPELILDNEDLWNFVRFAGEDHTNYRTLVAFLNLLTALVKELTQWRDSWAFVGG